MRSTFVALFAATALIVTAVDVYAMSSSSRRHGGGSNGTTTGGSSSLSASVPEPSALYAVGSGLVLLGGAGWFIRRRK